MSSGKYKRKRQRAAEQVQKKVGQVPVRKTEVRSPENQPPSAKASDSTRYDKKKNRMGLSQFIKRSSFTDWCLAVFTCALVVVTFFQYRIAAGQLDVMRIDQRAWMSIMIDGTPKTPVEGSTFDAVAHVVNTGKTPATHVHVDMTIEKVRNGETPDFRYLGRLFNGEISGIYLPNRSSTIPFSLLSLDPRNSEPVKLSKEDVDDLTQGKTYIVIFGGVEYVDIFGIRHWMRVCSWTPYGPPIMGYSAEPCAAFNAVDNNR